MKRRIVLPLIATALALTAVVASIGLGEWKLAATAWALNGSCWCYLYGLAIGTMR